MTCASVEGIAELLMSLALGQVDACPFDALSIQKLKRGAIDALEDHGLRLRREENDTFTHRFPSGPTWP